MEDQRLLQSLDPRDTIENNVKPEEEKVVPARNMEEEIPLQISPDPGDTTERNVRSEEEEVSVRSKGEKIPLQISPDPRDPTERNVGSEEEEMSVRSKEGEIPLQISPDERSIRNQTEEHATILSHDEDNIRAGSSGGAPPALSPAHRSTHIACHTVPPPHPTVSDLTLTYFPLRGRGEPIRLLLAGEGATWKEEVIQLPDWFGGKCDLKSKAVFGQLPAFQDGDYVLYQSNAILLYLGLKYDIAGSNHKESGQINMMNNGVEDLRMKFSKFVFYEFETGKEKYEKDLPNQLSYFEKILSGNSKGSAFLVGEKISYADYNLLDVLQCHQHFFPDCLSAFPLLSGYIERLTSRPNLSKYLNSEERISRPLLPKRG